MARGHADLAKIGREGFALIDERYGRTTSRKKAAADPPPSHYRQEPLLLQQQKAYSYLRPMPMVHPTADPIICRYRGAQTYDVLVITETTVAHHMVCSNFRV